MPGVYNMCRISNQPLLKKITSQFGVLPQNSTELVNQCKQVSTIREVIIGKSTSSVHKNEAGKYVIT